MISDRDIFRCAEILVRRHGAAAPYIAAHRADRLAREWNAQAQRLWVRVKNASEELLRDTRRAEEDLH